MHACANVIQMFLVDFHVLRQCFGKFDSVIVAVPGRSGNNIWYCRFCVSFFIILYHCQGEKGMKQLNSLSIDYTYTNIAYIDLVKNNEGQIVERGRNKKASSHWRINLRAFVAEKVGYPKWA